MTGRRYISLDEMLQTLNDADDDLETELDPAEVAEMLPERIDGYKFMIDRYEHQRAWCQAQAAAFEKTAERLAQLRAELGGRVLAAMQAKKFQKLPGVRYRVVVRNNPPSLVTLREPTDDDATEYPVYCETVTSYRWRKGYIKADLKAGTLDWGSKRPFAEIKVGQRAEFLPNIPGRTTK